MANISMDQVKELREKTQVGMMDCKKALLEADGNMEQAIELLRKKGAAVAAKRADNAMDNGRIEGYVSDDFKRGAIVELGCETDFSANTDDMKQFAIQAAQEATNLKINDAKELLDKSGVISERLNELLAKISEKIQVSKVAMFEVAEHGIVNFYIHPGSTVGVFVELATDHDASGSLEALKVAARDVCMHAAVTNPLCANPEDVDPTLLEKEQGLMREQLKGKPENIIEKIMLGKTNKYYEDVCLSKQKFIKDDKISVEQYLNTVGDSIKNSIKIKRFVRFGIGAK